MIHGLERVKARGMLPQPNEAAPRSADITSRVIMVNVENELVKTKGNGKTEKGEGWQSCPSLNLSNCVLAFQGRAAWGSFTRRLCSNMR